METKELKELRTLLGDPDELKVRQNGTDVLVEFGSMYESPLEKSFKAMKALSEFFGTDDLEWDDIRESGCETCDHGSRYGAELTFKNSKVKLVENGKPVKDLR